MPKKVIISESMFKKIVAGQLLEEAGMSKSEIANAVKDVIKNDRQIKQDMEKKVRDIVASTVNSLFRTLWQRRDFYADAIKKG